MKPAKLGNVWSAVARLYDRDKNEVGRCIDTPNAIGSALDEAAAKGVQVAWVRTILADHLKAREEYAGRRLDPACPYKSGLSLTTR